MPKSSSSDSDDSNDARLREATVSFDDLTKNNIVAKKVETNNDDPFHVEVTPEFQSFVAKKLTKILDEYVFLNNYLFRKYLLILFQIKYN